jgi:hypothetical protein
MRARCKELHELGIREVITPVGAWHLGDTVFPCLPGEPFVEWGLKLKQESPFPWTFPVELADDCVGYLVTPSAWEAGGYECLNSSGMVSVAGARTLVDESLKMLHELWESSRARGTPSA